MLEKSIRQTTCVTGQDRPIVFLFSGQGSHYYQMGKELFDSCVSFRKIILDVDNYLKSKKKLPLSEVLYAHDKKVSDTFDDLAYSHVAIFAVEYALAQTLVQQGVLPSVVLGASLGEFAALVTAGALSFYDGLDAVVTQASTIIETCDNAGMLAVLASPNLYYEDTIFERTTLTAINFDKHFVVTGKNHLIRMLEYELQQRRITHQCLPVSYGFHSPLIDNGRDAYFDRISLVSIKSPSISYYSCTNGGMLNTFSKSHLWTCISHPIEFQKTIYSLLNQRDYRFIDVGPAGTLATFVKYNAKLQKTSPLVYSVFTPFQGDMQRMESCVLACGDV